MPLWVKICGITSPEDAESAVAAGADAIGVNLVPSSKRRVDLPTARRLREIVADRAEVVAVVADLEAAKLVELRERTGIAWLQLHGSESVATLAELLPNAYKACRIGGAADVVAARAFGGERLLVDAKVEGTLGGSGRRFDWSLITELARERRLVLAGGLTPENVGAAVASVGPYGVDTASGVESGEPRRKDPSKVERFVRAARAALVGAGALLLLSGTGCSRSLQKGRPVAPDASLPGVIAVGGRYETRQCRDASGGPVPIGARTVALLVSARPGTSEPAPGAKPVALLDQRKGYESVLLLDPEVAGDSVVFRSRFSALDNEPLIQEIRLPLVPGPEGALIVSDARARMPDPGSPTELTRELVLACRLTPVGPS